MLPAVPELSWLPAFAAKAAASGIVIKVLSGLRTYDEQNDLYAQGRTKPGSIVTNACGSYSNHNFGVAFDIGVFEGSKYLDESPKYKAVGVLGTDLGLEWGGNWKTIQDEPHFQLRPKWASNLSERDMLAGLRSRKDSGEVCMCDEQSIWTEGMTLQNIFEQRPGSPNQMVSSRLLR
jgi:peptidoglycan L-alanyl-D-glutamate endopeptidase CwlK